MNEFVELSAEPSLTRNSLIFTGLTLRTFSTVVSDRFRPLPESVHVALPIRSPLKNSDPEVTVNVALTLSPGATGAENFFEVSFVLKTTDFHPLGTVILRVTSLTEAPVEFVKVTVVFCEVRGEKV